MAESNFLSSKPWMQAKAGMPSEGRGSARVGQPTWATRDTGREAWDSNAISISQPPIPKAQRKSKRHFQILKQVSSSHM